MGDFWIQNWGSRNICPHEEHKLKFTIVYKVLICAKGNLTSQEWGQLFFSSSKGKIRRLNVK